MDWDRGCGLRNHRNCSGRLESRSRKKHIEQHRRDRSDREPFGHWGGPRRTATTIAIGVAAGRPDKTYHRSATPQRTGPISGRHHARPERKWSSRGGLGGHITIRRPAEDHSKSRSAKCQSRTILSLNNTRAGSGRILLSASYSVSRCFLRRIITARYPMQFRGTMRHERRRTSLDLARLSWSGSAN